MADLSLGPLRIANPDDASPESPLQPQQTHPSIQSISPLGNLNGQHDYISLPKTRTDSPVSPLETPPEEPTHVGAQPVTMNQTTFQQRPIDRQRRQNPLPATYQDQQQAQFPKYPTMMPQNQIDPRANASRPGSTYYTHLPINGSTSSSVSRQSSYRMRSGDSSTAGPPQRSSSRRIAPETQPGVPARDDSHSERAYGTSQYSTTSNGAGQPRRSSKGVRPITNTPIANTPMSSTPMSTASVLSASPYNIEGGPLASSEEWQERGAAVGKRTEYDAEGHPVVRSVKKGVKDFNFGNTLGEGSYSTVLAAQDRTTLKDYAIKVLDKRHIIKEKKVKYVNIERDTLNRLTDHPGVVRLYYTFQDERSLYFVLDLCTGGELLGVLKRMTTFDEECTRFYGAQILDTIEYMHRRGVIHRDLKPENVLMDDNKHIKITDFGTAKLLPEKKDAEGHTVFESDSSNADNRASSFVGTAEYVSPELLTDKNACKASDLWAFGCIIYQLLAGRPPFKAGNEYQTFQKIVALDYEFPRGFPELAKDLVERLLVLEPQRRLTMEHIKNHPFFAGIKWGKGLWAQKAPKLKTYIPPPNPPIKLNGSNTPSEESFPPNIQGSHSTQATMLPPSNQRPQPRLITELPPPSQLDIEWSPVLTRNNERILKLGNLAVTESRKAQSPGEGGKFSRFFGGGNHKKRERLVMVTSSGRLIIAPAGGEEKKAKYEINIIDQGTEYSSSTDNKGITQWVVDTRDKHFVFEDTKPSSKEPMATAISTQEWLDALVRARDFAISLQERRETYSENDSLNVSSSALSSQPSMIDQPTDLSPHSASHGHSGRGILHKQHSGEDAASLKGRKRFSKRQSKSGLTAVF